MHDSRAPRIGIVLNNRGKGYAPSLEEQYTCSETRDGLARALSHHGAEVVEIEADESLLANLERASSTLDLVFNLAEGLPHCRSRQITVPAALDHLGVEWTGATVEGHQLAANKALARTLLGSEIVQPAWQYLAPGEALTSTKVSFPVLVKPINQGFSVGIEEAGIARSSEELQAAVTRLRERLDGPLLIESFLDGVEYSMGLVGDVVFPAVRWDLSKMPGTPRLRSEQLKKADLTIAYAELVREPELARTLAGQAVRAHQVLGLRDYSRTDFRARSGAPDPFYLETNSMPGLQDLQSILPWSASRAGVDYVDLVGSIVALALRRLDGRRREQLSVHAFEDAYERLRHRSRPSQVVNVEGHEYRLLEPSTTE